MRTISIKGTGKSKKCSDQVIFRISTSLQAKSYEESIDLSNQLVNKLKNQFENIGFNAEIPAEASSVKLGNLIKIDYGISDFNFISKARYDVDYDMDVCCGNSPMEFTPDSIEITDSVMFVVEII